MLTSSDKTNEIFLGVDGGRSFMSSHFTLNFEVRQIVTFLWRFGGESELELIP
jgi:hypothetical protein